MSVDGQLLGHKMSHKSTNQSTITGPGAYSTEKHNTIGKNSKTYSFGKASNVKEGGSTPGPGSYLFDDKGKNNKGGFATDRIDRIVDVKRFESTPGPGNYNLPNNTFKKGFTIKKDEKQPRDLKVPGPGEYDINKNKIKGSTIGTSKRTPKINTKEIDLTNPGPGMYNSHHHSKEKAKAYKFGKDERMKDPKTLTPGPGQYKLPYSLNVGVIPDYQLAQGKFDLSMKYIWLIING